MIDKKIIKTSKKYIAHLRSQGIRIEKVVIFGSQVNGKARFGSDIDMCIVSSIFGKDRHSERIMLMKLLDSKTLEIEPHPYSPADFEDTYDSLANEIRKHGIVIE